MSSEIICETKSREEFHEFCMMADMENVDSQPSTSGSTGEDTKVFSNYDTNLLAKFKSMQSEFIDLKSRLKGESALVNRFRIDYAVYKTSYEDLDLNFTKVIKESAERETYLKTTLSKLQLQHKALISDHGEVDIKFAFLSKESIHLYEKN